MLGEVDDEEVTVEKVNLHANAVTFPHLLDMKRRLEGVFQLTNSHAYLYFEAKRLVLEVLDSDMRGLAFFVLQQKDYIKTGGGGGVLPLYMETWRIMSHVLKTLPNRRKNKVQLRLEWIPGGYKFGFVTLETEEFTYLTILYAQQNKGRGSLPSLYCENPILEPTKYLAKLTLKCPLQFEIMCKECCTYGETLKLSVSTELDAVVMFTEKHINRINYTIPAGGSLLKIEYQGAVTRSNNEVYQFPLRILRVITRFCSGIDTLVIYLGTPVTFVAKRNSCIRWTLRIRG